MKMFYAHSVEGKPIDEWHLLDEHLKGTAELAQGDCPGLRPQLVGDFGKRKMTKRFIILS